ncbi:hypothetical protein Acr_09g0008490 [Actinidia rufa]|uniref:Uncharacterized protein n=1 Tax=Actinidia rufa TaxID=165716 RepID=A0A7J0F715_9ERIC|nr:hypothetical protein Acr_09g0008490 [Actinidia rufa]
MLERQDNGNEKDDDSSSDELEDSNVDIVEDTQQPDGAFDDSDMIEKEEFRPKFDFDEEADVCKKMEAEMVKAMYQTSHLMGLLSGMTKSENSGDQKGLNFSSLKLLDAADAAFSAANAATGLGIFLKVRPLLVAEVATSGAVVSRVAPVGCDGVRVLPGMSGEGRRWLCLPFLVNAFSFVFYCLIYYFNVVRPLSIAEVAATGGGGFGGAFGGCDGMWVLPGVSGRREMMAIFFSLF